MATAIELANHDFKPLSVKDALKRLQSDPDSGLSPSDAKERLEEFGLNEIEEHETNPVLKFLSHFWGPIPWMIEIAIILSAIAGRWEDLVVISFMLLMNGGVSFWHEHKADNEIKALKERLSPEARVIRGGERNTIDAKQLVPGDVIRLQIGDVAPADAKLIDDSSLRMDESSLTGESLPVQKDQGEIIYSGTSVKSGDARALVTATGGDSKFARTVELVEQAGERSHFQKAVVRIGYFLITLTLLLVILIVGTGWWRGDPLMDVLLFSMVLIIAGIPQALPAVLTITMTVGAKRLARKKAIVSRLPAMEEMAGLEVLCADKTGTLTKNELELQEPIVYDADDQADLILSAALASKRDGDDPIDKAVLSGLEDESQLDSYEIKEFRPFDPTRKRAEADVEKDGETLTVAKGAPQVILKLCDLDEDRKNEIAGKIDSLASDGYRSIGCARRTNGNWSFLGLLPLLDPPLPDSSEVLSTARSQDIDIRMITGDHKAIAENVASQAGMGRDIVNADAIFSDNNSMDDDSSEDIESADGFAQVTPEHKFKLIRAFQSDGRIVGMTGDGVNDAPALKQADVGIAVASAADAARASSDLVLSRQGLDVITHAIQEARRIFERMNSYAIFRITETMRVLMFMSISILAFQFYPVTPIMIVLLAILNDIPIMTIASDNVPTARRPVRWDMKRVVAISSVLSVTGVISSFILLWYFQTQTSIEREALQTVIFLKLLVAGHLTIFLTRNKGFMWDKPWPSPLLFISLEGTQIVGTLAAVYGWLVHPIGWPLALGVWGYSIAWLLALNVMKVAAYRVLDRQGNEYESKRFSEAEGQTA